MSLGRKIEVDTQYSLVGSNRMKMPSSADELGDNATGYL